MRVFVLTFVFMIPLLDFNSTNRRIQPISDN